MGKLMRERVEELKPAAVMVVVQVALAAASIFYKLAANDGMSLKVIVAYRFIFATAFMIPLALALERKKQPKFRWSILVHALVCGLFGGSLFQNLYLASLALTSPTFASAVANLVYALCSERDWSQWKLRWNVRLLIVAYSGMVASGLMVMIIVWCVKKRGPLFVSVFIPLMLVCVAIASSLLLDEKLRLGSVLGSTLIIWGLYVVIWGKGKEMEQMVKELSTLHDNNPIISRSELGRLN